MPELTSDTFRSAGVASFSSTIFANSKTPSAGYFFLGVKFDGGGRTLQFNYDNAGGLALNDLVLPHNQWVHVAISRDASNVVRVFLDGVPSATTTTIAGDFGGTSGGASHFTIGVMIVAAVLGVPFVSADFDGYFDNIRVTRGLCRYNSPFTPPIAPFPTSGP